MEKVIVHPRILRLHPELTEEDILDAWDSIIHSRARLEEKPFECIAVGIDSSGRLIEMVAIRLENRDILIFHAMVPPSKKTLKELDLLGKRRKEWM